MDHLDPLNPDDVHPASEILELKKRILAKLMRVDDDGVLRLVDELLERHPHGIRLPRQCLLGEVARALGGRELN